jgi:hypothetical protein
MSLSGGYQGIRDGPACSDKERGGGGGGGGVALYSVNLAKHSPCGASVQLSYRVASSPSCSLLDTAARH